MHLRYLIIGYICSSILLAGFVYVSGLFALRGLATSLLIYYIISYLLYLGWKKITGKESLNPLHFFIYFIYRVSLSLSIILGVVILFCLYHNEVRPAKLPLHTLTNGTQTLQFQTMSHLASRQFYRQVQNNIFDAKRKGYILFYEGVRPGSEENHQKFNAQLGVDFDAGLYENLSLLYGLVAQNNDDFLGMYNTQDYNIDLSMDEIMEIFEQKTSGGEQNSTRTLSENDIISQEHIIASISSLSARQLHVLRYMNQAIINLIIKHENLRTLILNSIGKEDIFSVILDERNQHLVDAIMSREEENIIILYGLMHFEGVFELLQDNNPAWRIIESQYYPLIP